MKHTLALGVLMVLVLSACSDDKGTNQPSASKSKPANAQRAEKIRMAFTQSDTDKDGKMSHEEFVVYANTLAASRFGKFDSNLDNAVDAEEFKASKVKMQQRLEAKGVAATEIAERIARQFASFDIDNIGSLTLAEYAQRIVELQFEKKDKDSDGYLTAEEFLGRSAR